MTDIIVMGPDRWVRSRRCVLRNSARTPHSSRLRVSNHTGPPRLKSADPSGACNDGAHRDLGRWAITVSSMAIWIAYLKDLHPFREGLSWVYCPDSKDTTRGEWEPAVRSDRPDFKAVSGTRAE